ncbi:extracellular solute-binding protein [Catenulispora sp. NF23]|uniref:ABC transporter substrate-binding protein n=1 Tax=Catenulispora pinistramenti TaxID=2705254 RepID=UPI001BA71B3A|nr:extracellular solute-binding protein [Catenulispora pinistramenti]MBS2531701.1 extracellular solute-binding protein [Catenulispora pinistramenti]
MVRISRFVLIAGCVATALTAAGCSSSSKSGSGSGSGSITLHVQGMPPATDRAGTAQFQQMVADFEKANPGIKVQGSTNVYDPMTFSAKLAAHTVEDVIKVPLTEPQRLIAQGQVRSITGQLQAWDHYKEFNPQVLAPLSDAGGQVYGVPQNPYAQGLMYNRALFTAAGLDPDKPPTTWDEVRTDAAAIAEKTGKAGFVAESKDNQGGWQLTMLTYAFGGDIEKKTGGEYVSAFDDAPTKDALNLLKSMRWSDNSMGASQLNNQTDVVKAFAAGQIGMFLGSPGTYRLAKMTYGMTDTASFGAAAMPQAGGGATLTGSDVYMVPKSVDAKHAEAAAKWLIFAYALPAYDTTAAAEQAKTLAADPKAAVGVPTLPVFDAARQAQIADAIKPYVNVDLSHFTPYTSNLAALKLRPEPEFEAQKVYAVLDTVMQAVLTDKGADVDSLLAAAHKSVDAILSADQK